MPTESLGKKRYFVSFTDDYSRCCQVYLMKHKSEALDKFKEFEAQVTNESGLSIGTLRTDNGGEYTSVEFENFLKSKGIKHECTVPYSTEQNGVAERLNHTLMESARSMMCFAGLPDSYWGEAVVTAAYIRNRVPTRAFREKVSPYERWYGHIPDLKHFKVFGYVAYAHIPDSQRDKLNKKAEKIRFVGYSTRSKGYRLLNEKTTKIKISRDVIFNESNFNTDKDRQENSTCNDIQEGVPLDSYSEDTPTQEQVAETRRQSSRQRHAPVRYGTDEYVEAAISYWTKEPISIEEALADKDWSEAANAEYSSLIENDTWELVDLPHGRKPVQCK